MHTNNIVKKLHFKCNIVGIWIPVQQSVPCEAAVTNKDLYILDGNDRHLVPIDIFYQHMHPNDIESLLNGQGIDRGMDEFVQKKYN